EPLPSLVADALMGGGVVADEPRRVDRLPRVVEGVPEPREPTEVGAAEPVARGRRETCLRKALGDILERRTRFVDGHVAVAERRHALQRVDESEPRDLVTAPQMDVDRRVLRTGLLERCADGKARGTGDLEELEHPRGNVRRTGASACGAIGAVVVHSGSVPVCARLCRLRAESSAGWWLNGAQRSAAP